MNRLMDDVTNIPLAWKRLEAALEAHDRSLSATLRPPLRKKLEDQQTTIAWFRAHDGQRPRARPLFRGFRLLSYAEGEQRTKRFRGWSYRRDWTDQWKVVGQAGTHRLLCYDDVSTGVFEVDVASEPYRKSRICFGMAKWLDLATKSVESAMAGSRSSRPRAAARSPSR